MVQQEEFRPSSDAFCHLASGNSVNSTWIKQKKQHKKTWCVVGFHPLSCLCSL